MAQKPNRKVILVTGAGKGIGAFTAREFANKGYLVAANDITPVNLEVVALEIINSGGVISQHIHDVAKKLDAQALINDVIDLYGQIDLLVNTANVNLTSGLLSADEWDLHRVFDVNIIGTILLIQSAGRVMRDQGFGSIVNILPVKTGAGITQLAIIAALETLTNAAKNEFKNHNINLIQLTHSQVRDWISDIPFNY